MMDYQAALDSVMRDPRYLKNLDEAVDLVAQTPRPEAHAIRAHIEEIEKNLEALRPRLSDLDYRKLKLLVHTHDTFKGEAKPDVGITDPRSHASLARDFLAIYCPDPDLLAMVQFHDEPFARWRQFKAKCNYNQERFSALLQNIRDWNLFLAFNIVDGCTEGKGREPLAWFFNEVDGRVESTFSVGDIL